MITIVCYSTKVSLGDFLEMLKKDFPTMDISKLGMTTSGKGGRFEVDEIELFFERTVDGKIIHDYQSLTPENGAGLGEWISKKFFCGKKGGQGDFEKLQLPKRFYEMNPTDLIEIHWINDFPSYIKGKTKVSID